MNRLNLEQLHECVAIINQSRTPPKQHGCTEAYIQLMIGEVELGDFCNNYWYIGENEAACSNAMARFVELIKLNYPSLQLILYRSHPRVIIKDTDQQFSFGSIRNPSMLESRLCGTTIHRLFFDVSYESQISLDERGKLQPIMREILVHLKERVGDIL